MDPFIVFEGSWIVEYLRPNRDFADIVKSACKSRFRSLWDSASHMLRHYLGHLRDAF